MTTPQPNITPGASAALPALLNAADFASFQSLSPDWFLPAVSETIRVYCNWHIYPVIPVQDRLYRLYPDHAVLLPSLRVLSVESVSIGDHTLDAADYTLHPEGWIDVLVHRSSWPLGLITRRGERYVHVSFTHGYDACPPAVAEVGYEIAMRAMEKPAGIARSMGAGPYSFSFCDFGAYLTDDQRHRLAPFALQGVA
jgi:hypothetical protein